MTFSVLGEPGRARAPPARRARWLCRGCFDDSGALDGYPVTGESAGDGIRQQYRTEGIRPTTEVVEDTEHADTGAGNDDLLTRRRHTESDPFRETLRNERDSVGAFDVTGIEQAASN
jgi:hypothetical protein